LLSDQEHRFLAANPIVSSETTVLMNYRDTGMMCFVGAVASELVRGVATVIGVYAK
jgi:hypothetical protein